MARLLPRNILRVWANDPWLSRHDRDNWIAKTRDQADKRAMARLIVGRNPEAARRHLECGMLWRYTGRTGTWAERWDPCYGCRLARLCDTCHDRYMATWREGCQLVVRHYGDGKLIHAYVAPDYCSLSAAPAVVAVLKEVKARLFRWFDDRKRVRRQRLFAMVVGIHAAVSRDDPTVIRPHLHVTLLTNTCIPDEPLAERLRETYIQVAATANNNHVPIDAFAEQEDTRHVCNSVVDRSLAGRADYESFATVAAGMAYPCRFLPKRSSDRVPLTAAEKLRIARVLPQRHVDATFSRGGAPGHELHNLPPWTEDIIAIVLPVGVRFDVARRAKPLLDSLLQHPAKFANMTNEQLVDLLDTWQANFPSETNAHPDFAYQVG